MRIDRHLVRLKINICLVVSHFENKKRRRKKNVKNPPHSYAFKDKERKATTIEYYAQRRAHRRQKIVIRREYEAMTTVFLFVPDQAKLLQMNRETRSSRSDRNRGINKQRTSSKSETER